MRGEQSRLSASVLDADGTPKYYIVPDRLIIFGFGFFMLMFALAVFLGFIILYNRVNVDEIKEQRRIEQEQWERRRNKDDTQNTDRQRREHLQASI